MIDTLLNQRYLLQSEIGRGGMGVVYRARDTVLEREVAVKLVSTAGLGTEGQARLLQEARAAARLNHPNIAAVHDAGEAETGPEEGRAAYIVMELVEGPSLRAYEPASLDDSLAVAWQICSALDAAHAKGIIHRDLKPENVLLTGQPAGQPDDDTAAPPLVKLMDFGLARVTGSSRLTREGTLIGTLAYLAPELILGQPANPQSDLYAMGVLFYELLTGRPPFEGENAAVLLSNHLHAPVVPPSAYNEAVWPELDILAVQLLEKESSLRPASAKEVMDRLTLLRAEAAPTPPAWPAADATFQLDRIARGRLVGRQQELAEATQVWLQSLSGQGSLLLISGEPGIGKTRLARALIAQAQSSGATALAGGCYEYEASTPYLPLAEALRDWVGRQSNSVLKDRLATTAAELVRLAPEIGARLPNLEPNPPLAPQEERLRLFDNVGRFLANLALQRGLVLFIDDLHWADQGTLSLLSYLLRRLREERLLIVATYREVELDRTHPLADALVDWHRQRLATRIALARFTPEETNRMIATLFGQERVSNEFARAIHRETEGNPFFIEEVVKSMVEQGQIYRVGDHWERKELRELAIPQSIREAIGRRLNRLSPSCVDVLHTAAAIGKTFTFELLVAVSGDPEESLLEALEEADAAQLIQPAGSDSFVFTHDKIREVLYEELIPIRRHRLHRRIGHSLESWAAAGRPARVEDMAYHFTIAGDLEKGLLYSLRAAEKAKGLFAVEEAVRYYEQALECALSLNNQGQQLEIEEALGDLYATNGPFERAITHYQRALSLAEEPARRAAIKVQLGLAFNITNDERGLSVLSEALEELDPERQPAELAGALTAMGRYYHIRAEYSRAIDFYERARTLAEPADDPQVLAYIYAYLSGAYQHLAQFPEALSWAQACIDLGRRRNYQWSVAIGHEFEAEEYYALGRWAEAAEAAALDRKIGQTIGSEFRVAWADFLTGAIHWGQGNLSEAGRLISQALASAGQLGERRLAVLCRAFLARAQTDLGQAEEALTNCQLGLEESDAVGELNLRASARSTLGYYYMGQSQYAEAAEWYRRCFAILEDSEIRGTLLQTRAQYASALVQLGELAMAASLVEEQFRQALETESVHQQGLAHRVQGQIQAAQGLYEAAGASFETAITLLEANDSHLELGRAFYQRGLMWQDRGDVALAQSDLARALDIFEACQAADSQKATAALDSLPGGGAA